MGTRRPVSAVDATWLGLDTETNPMVITAMLGLDGPIAPRALAELVEHVAAFPRFRQRVAPPSLGVGVAHWEDDPYFDAALHVHRVAVPSPGGRTTLAELLGDLMSQQLDPSRPLWQLYVVEGVEPPVGHGVALVSRVHHALGDGFALVRMLLALAGTGALPPEVGLPPAPPPSRLAERAVRVAKSAAALGKIVLAPYDEKTPFTGRQSRGKHVAWSRAVPLGRVKAIAAAAGAKTNDVLMASVTAGLRAYLLAEGRLRDGLVLHALVPVLLGSVTGDATLGNHFGFVLPELPVTRASAMDRVRAMRAAMVAAKTSAEADMSFLLIGAEGFAGRAVDHFVADWYTRKGSLVVTNIAGPPQPVEIGGRTIESIAVFPPTSGRVSLGVGLLSYAGSVSMAVRSDARLVPDPRSIVAAFEADLDELAAAVAPAAVPHLA